MLTIYAGFYIIIAFAYKNICNIAFELVNCISSGNDESFLYISGDVTCYSWWQIVNFIFLVTWVAPFPLAAGLGYSLLKNNLITIKMFVFFLCFPIASPVFFVYKTFCKHEQCNEQNAQSEKRRLLIVVGTDDEGGDRAFWEPWIPW